jgi:ABC-2 type transport system permease protein
MQFLRTTLLFWRTYLPRILRARRTLIVALGCALIPVAALFLLGLEYGPSPIEAFMYPSYYMVLMVLVPLAAVITGSVIVSEEVEDRTISYLLTRPIPRATILLGRWLACATVLSVMFLGTIGGLRAVVEWKATTWRAKEPQTVEWTNRRGEKRTDERKHKGPPELLTAMEDGELPEGLFEAVLVSALLGAAVYSALFAALGTSNRHPMIVGLGYAFAIELFLSNLPGSSQALSVQYYLRSMLLSSNPDLWGRLQDVQLKTYDTTGQALATLAIVLVVSLGAGSWVISRRQYILSA